MKVKVSLLTILKRYASAALDDDGTCELADGSTLDDLSSRIGIPEHVVKIYLVNGKPRHAPHVLNERDEVRIFSFVGGG